MSVLELLDDMGQYIHSVPYFPFLHTIHCYATSASLRSQKGAVEFAHEHPLASLAGNLLIVNAGGVMAAVALGTPLIAPFGNVLNTLTAILMWWLVYFGPGDLFFNLYKIKPLQLTMTMVRETRRCRKILDTWKLALNVMPDKWIVLILVGALGGCSGKFMQASEESLRLKSTDVSKSEFLRISFVTKASLLISLFYTLVHYKVITLTMSQALLISSVCLVSVNLSMVLAGLPDPFHPIAQATWKVVSIASRNTGSTMEQSDTKSDTKPDTTSAIKDTKRKDHSSTTDKKKE